MSRARVRRFPKIFFPRWRLKRFKKLSSFRRNFVKLTRQRPGSANWLLSRENNFGRRELLLKFLAWKFNVSKQALVSELLKSSNRSVAVSVSILKLFFYLNTRLDIMFSRWLAPINLKGCHGIISLGWVTVNQTRIFTPSHSLVLGDSVQSLVWNRLLVKSRRLLKSVLTSSNYVRRFGWRYDLTPQKFLQGGFIGASKYLEFSTANRFTFVQSLSALYGRSTLKFKVTSQTFLVKKHIKALLLNNRAVLLKLVNKVRIPVLLKKKLNSRYFLPKGAARARLINYKRYSLWVFRNSCFFRKLGLLNNHFTSNKNSVELGKLSTVINRTASKNLFHSTFILVKRMKARGKNADSYRPVGLRSVVYKLPQPSKRALINFSFIVKTIPSLQDPSLFTLMQSHSFWRDPLFILSLDINSYYLSKGLRRVL
jgi:hypothetical protein